jgi:hypothetical protein
MFGATDEVTEEVKTAVDRINKHAKTESSIIIRGGSNLPAETRRNSSLYEIQKMAKDFFDEAREGKHKYRLSWVFLQEVIS